ncbi:deoxyxylulose-5-phosphate synthase [Candidatus Desulforudis audaxviator MP104C]|uniref:1-deoxy-D-xylulose-5-phosphate synthase n=1 Tax=Desulforudis audaxviator (strain MP104C) TaxID=477974 RepID=DXS_DESAP|nr:1-deoxy-D-xylulose-5-phosphate synthase [Candidatus Desulforudis audaxviator]B1I3J6.1 RecName: Full=1-deoxy-D-xylulose-5-phosphate synthase; AltName: Full=1-deoxyxylulose-5-phosphate synthase; Short=DXP synthase; Short=DXPS [Candidatus Desulforudis audaxviator MP104C]ACA59539.1 deoxyxylulose-5-phosphate synthase [Candidatus Desulforudis audaxviator MP104C]
MGLLDGISHLTDLRALTPDQLDELAAELRDLIVSTVSRTGGHLAPNLGVVELTLALHYVFRAPDDRIVWDVGHQCYVHKILTGRKSQFHTLRQFEGLSGFPNRNESEYDCFGTGHSSTSISAALGMALARDLSGEDRNVVAVIGDGALSGGMAFEALNQAGHLGCRLIVVLNDNEMSIARNVGAMARYLSRLRTDPMYSRSKDEVESLLRRIPAIGPRVLGWIERIKDSLKYLVVAGMLFEELGFTYLGPIDGHNIPAMLNVFRQAQAVEGPVLVHVLTKKGKGYAPAEKNPDKFHGVGPFDPATGNTPTDARVSFTEVFGRTLVQLAEADSRILAITAAMTSGTGLGPFSRRFPQRFFDVGIAEQHAVTLAAGLAVEGYRPVVAIYSTFLQRAYDQVLHDVCLQKLPVVFALDRGGIVGEDGVTHQGVFDFSFLRPVPNLVMMAPKDENEFQHMLKTAVEHEGPIAVRYPRGTGTGCALDQDLVALPIGRAEVLREGDDITLIAIGNMVPTAVKAAEILAERGIEASVVNARFVKPLDEKCICHYARRTGRLITLEENVIAGGFGSAVQELLVAKGLTDVRVQLIGLPDVFIEHGAPHLLRAKYGLTVDRVVRTAESEKRKRARLKLAPRLLR